MQLIDRDAGPGVLIVIVFDKAKAALLITHNEGVGEKMTRWIGDGLGPVHDKVLPSARAEGDPPAVVVLQQDPVKETNTSDFSIVRIQKSHSMTIRTALSEVFAPQYLNS